MGFEEETQEMKASIMCELYATRIRLGIGQGEIAVEIGVDPATVRRWEGGEVNYEMKRLDEYNEALHVIAAEKGLDI